MSHFFMGELYCADLCWSVGDNSGKVVIWNMAPVRDERIEKNENIPKMLCTMDNHLGEYSASPTARRLASETLATGV